MTTETHNLWIDYFEANKNSISDAGIGTNPYEVAEHAFLSGFKVRNDLIKKSNRQA